MSSSREVLAGMRRRLAESSSSAALDAELLLAHVLGVRRPGLAADPGRLLTPGEAAAVEALMRRRLAGEPVAYLTGRREFWSLDLEVTPDVLVPRPETETLVELALAALADVPAPRVLDLGTGSGAIALALAYEREDAVVAAVDASAAALEVAEGNAARLGIDNVTFLRGSWFEPVAGRCFDGIVANPPYVAEGDPALAALAFEPREALVAGREGLAAIAEICAGARAHLGPGGFLLVEHGAAHGVAVRELMTSAGLREVATHADLASLERVTGGSAPARTLESA